MMGVKEGMQGQTTNSRRHVRAHKKNRELLTTRVVVSIYLAQEVVLLGGLALLE